MAQTAHGDAEQTRLEEARTGKAAWKEWGPYLSERQWGTVREDYSENGNAWDYFTHDQARSRAYRWGEDGLAGVSDSKQRLCFALALWNGKDPILKERLFGLTNREGNHGEDVKEYYFYLDSTPTHSYMRYLYKYPQRAYPYSDLVETNARRGKQELEYELLDTGVFDDDRYFDVFVEYAKAGPDDLLIRIQVFNRGPEAASLQLLPTLWFRNTWSWGGEPARPVLRRVLVDDGIPAVAVSHEELGERLLLCPGAAELLFTENETNTERLAGTPNRTPFVKDGIGSYLVHGRHDAVNRDGIGTKVAAHYPIVVGPGRHQVIRLWLGRSGAPTGEIGREIDALVGLRREEADEFYATVLPESLDDDSKRVMRQALAGMLWSKQAYTYDVYRWLGEHGSDPFAPGASEGRNRHWQHMANADVISMRTEIGRASCRERVFRTV